LHQQEENFIAFAKLRNALGHKARLLMNSGDTAFAWSRTRWRLKLDVFALIYTAKIPMKCPTEDLNFYVRAITPPRFFCRTWKHLADD
jgi:hypothetical protein